MKKIALLLATALTLTCCLSVLSGCGNNAEREYQSAVNAAREASNAAKKAESDYNYLKNALK